MQEEMISPLKPLKSQGWNTALYLRSGKKTLILRMQIIQKFQSNEKSVYKNLFYF